MKKNIAVLPGDGVGPEITSVAVDILKKIADKFGHEFTFTEGLIGAAAIDATGEALPQKTTELCLSSDAVLFGAIGDPKYDNDPSAKVRPEQGILALRKGLGLYANVRPIFTFADFASNSPLKPEIIDGVDFIVIRELIGGIYFGKKGRSADGTSAFDTNEYTKEEIERVARYAFELVKKRASHRHAELVSASQSNKNKTRSRNEFGMTEAKGKLTVVDKANVLETSRLWRETVQAMEKDYPDIIVDYMFVDNAAMQLIKRPSEFDVVVTENMFGDILTDEASVITGSIGMLPSASIGEKTAVYEPIHGSFPRAAGQNIANPIGSILSAAMLLEYSFGMQEEATAISDAVKKALAAGIGTKDIVGENYLGTKEFGEEVTKRI